MSCCVGCERNRGGNWCFLSKEAEARSCFAQIWQCHSVMGAARNACSKANQLSEPPSWQQSLINPRPRFSWGKKHDGGITSIMKALRKHLGGEEGLANTFTLLERMENGCDHQFCGPTALWKLVPRRAHDPLSEKAVNAIGTWAARVHPTPMESCSSGNFCRPMAVVCLWQRMGKAKRTRRPVFGLQFLLCFKCTLESWLSSLDLTACPEKLSWLSCFHTSRVWAGAGWPARAVVRRQVFPGRLKRICLLVRLFGRQPHTSIKPINLRGTPDGCCRAVASTAR